MFDLLVALSVWYGLGFAAAAWAGHRGHDQGLWTILAALWGAASIPILMLVRLFLRTRTAKVAPPERSLDGGTAAVVMHVEDSPAAIAEQLRSLTEPIRTLAVIVLVTEEASSGVVGAAEKRAAETTVRCMVRNTPPVRTTTAIVSLSGLEELVRQGWRADMLVTGALVDEHPLGAPMARAVKRLTTSEVHAFRPVRRQPAGRTVDRIGEPEERSAVGAP